MNVIFNDIQYIYNINNDDNSIDNCRIIYSFTFDVNSQLDLKMLVLFKLRATKRFYYRRKLRQYKLYMDM
jgi:hypothetical protein